MIAQYCKQNHLQWDRHLPDFQLALNSSRHDSTEFTPAFLNFGHELTLLNTVYQDETETPEDTHWSRNRRP
ncbi:hypothetical protein NQ314_018536 [Rhamnusium bicolor]|uniref:Uncharacterized protein n=1 Tax=Rhamnusium bicolor TaxID=1586634 RepID=A0AAV8WQ16_9CUCU|nr:hypothetical protein NQ314_018536 [Rhamnusium bicolor]